MCQNTYLCEQLAVERHRELEREIAQRHLLAGLPRQHRNVGWHLVGRLGAMLVALGTRLEQVEQRRGEQAIHPINIRVYCQLLSV